jgi:hypothetical protein
LRANDIDDMTGLMAALDTNTELVVVRCVPLLPPATATPCLISFQNRVKGNNLSEEAEAYIEEVGARNTAFQGLRPTLLAFVLAVRLSRSSLPAELMDPLVLGYVLPLFSTS